MISRIETLDDLKLWLTSITFLSTKNVAIEQLTNDQAASLCSALKTIDQIKSRFPDPFKQCVKCKNVWPETKEWFDWNGRGRVGLSSICKFCRNATRRNQRKRGHPQDDQAQAEIRSEIARLKGE